MFWVRTTSGLELVCRAMTTRPDSNGFVTLTDVSRLTYPLGRYKPTVGSFIKEHGTALEVRVAIGSIEAYTDKVALENPKGKA